MDNQLDTSASTPTPAPAPTAPAPAPVVDMPMNYGDGGGGGNIVMDTIKSVSPLEWILSILGTTALIYSIYYFRNNIEINKAKTGLENKIDELEIKISDLSSAIQNQKQQQQQQQQQNSWV
jgi:hypothetical protein